MKKLLLIFILTVGFFSCDDRLEELNTPQKNAASVPAETLFSNGLREMFDLMASTDVNSNVFRLYAQYWAQTTYPDESQYNMVGREIPDNFWTFAYRDAIRDLDEAAKVTEATAEQLGLTDAEKANRLAIINTCKAYMFAILVDAFGAVPFSEAINDDILTPKYDAGADVYAGVIAMLDEAIAAMDPASEGFSEAQDPVYQGDVAGWLKFANSFKLRLAINLADVNPGEASSMIAEVLAVPDGLILDNADNASISYLAEAPNTSPVWEDLVQSGRADYVVANTLVDKLLALNDPRLPVYAQETEDGEFIGGEYGTANTYSANSPAGTLFHDPTLEGVILDAAQVNFLLAEAAARGISVGGTAEEFYNEGITQSMLYYGVAPADIALYLLQPDVAYATAAGDYKQKIGTQSWIALYNHGFEGWTVWRRLDFTGFNVPDGLTAADIPNRFIFPIEEATLNKSALTAAISLIGGADNVQTKVFWDVN
jgi:hypothetical protein